MAETWKSQPVMYKTSKEWGLNYLVAGAGLESAV